MHLTLTVYTDDTLTEVARVAEADRLKIPYRVAMYVAKSLDTMDLKSKDDIFDFVISSLDKVDRIIKATFMVSDEELECVDIMELGNVVAEIYNWGMEKIGSLEGGSKNAVTAASMSA